MGSGGTSTKLDISSNFYKVIDGQLTKTEQTRHGINPATGEPNPEVPVSTEKDVDDAVNSARQAFKTWTKTPWDVRKQAILAFADALETNSEDFAKMLTQEQGKPYPSALNEIRAGVHFIRSLATIVLDKSPIASPRKKDSRLLLVSSVRTHPLRSKPERIPTVAVDV